MLKAQWDNLFSKELYAKFLSSDQSLPQVHRNFIGTHELKFMIALDYPNEKICSFIQSIKIRSQLDLPYPPDAEGITALHLAVMKERIKVVKALLQAGSNVDAKDAHNWTPLHHAALISDNLVQILLNNKADGSALTKLQATYQDIRSLRGTEKTSKRANIFFQEEGKQPEKIPESDLSTRLKIEYIDEYVWPAELFYILWSSSQDEYANRAIQSQIRTQLYPKLKKNPPAVILAEEKHQEKFIGLGVQAGELIEPLRLVGEYTGEIINFRSQSASRDLTYVYELGEEKGYSISVDAKNKGNWTKYINDGFPNLISFDLYNTAGQKWRKVFFAIDPNGIKPGEFFNYDYTWMYSHLKWGRYIISKKIEMRGFLSNFSSDVLELQRRYTYLFNPNNRNRLTYKDCIRYNGLEARLFYPFQTPMALIDLVFSQTIDAREWINFIDQEEKKPNSLFRAVLNENESFSKTYNLLIKLERLDDNLRYISQGPRGKEVSDTIRNLFLIHEDILAVPELISKIEELNHFFAEHINEEEASRFYAEPDASFYVDLQAIIIAAFP
jgi:hypothetical protein